MTRLNGAFKQCADVLAIQGVVEVPEVASELVFFLEEIDLIALVGNFQSRGHAGDAASDDNRFVNYRQRNFTEGLDQPRIGDRHPDQVFRLFRRFSLLLHVNPGALVADVRHFEQVLVQSGLPHRFSEHRFVGSWRTGRHDDPVQFVLLDGILDFCLSVLRAGIEVVLDMDDIFQRLCILPDLGHVDDAADIDPAVADEYANPGFLVFDISFRRILSFNEHRSPRQ